MSQEVKRFFIMPGAVHVMQGDSPAYTPMTNHETFAHTVPVVLASDYDALLAERARLAAENERLARDAKNDSIAYRAVIERQEELRAEVEALKKDAERLDRLDIECEAYGCEGIHEGNRWMIDGPFRAVRDAIDAAMQGDRQ